MGTSERKGGVSRRWYNPDSPVLNAIVTGICLLGLAGSLLLFWRASGNSRRVLAEQPVGTAAWSTGNVQRRSAGRLLWDRLSGYAPVYDGDVITSPANAALWLNMANGETVELAEHTSIRLLYRDGEFSRVELAEGDMAVFADRYTVTVSPGGRGNQAVRVNINPKSRILARFREDRVFGLTVLQGSCSFFSNGENRRLSAGEAVRAGEDGTVLDGPAAAMLSPWNGKRILTPARAARPVEFLWRNINLPVDGEVRLDIAADPQFTRMAASFLGRGVSAEVSLGTGSYYWRVYPAGLPAAADSGRLDIVYAPENLALAPADGDIFRYVSQAPPVRFSWLVPDEVSSVLLEVADNPGLSRPLFSRTLENTAKGHASLVYTGLQEGDWYWRVRPVYPEGAEGPVYEPAARHFTVIRDADLTPPVPVSPPAAGFVEAGEGQGNIYFSWKSEPEAASYTVQISRSPDLQNPLVSRTVSRNFLAYRDEENLLERGTYYWGVSAADSQGRHSASSASLPFTVRNGETALRTIFPPDNYEVPANRSRDIYFRWKSTLPRHARLQISQRVDFANPLVEDKLVYGAGVSSRYLLPGTYYWRISTGGGPSRFDSPPARLVILPALKAPAMESPAGDSVIRVTESVPVVFSWQRVNYADYYHFRLYSEERDSPLCEITSLRDNRLQVHFDPRTEGRFRWTVQAFTLPAGDASGRAGLVSTGRFAVGGGGTGTGWAIPRIANVQSFSGDVSSPITLVSPQSGANIAGLSALRSPPVARWTSDVPLDNAQLFVSRSFDPLSDPLAIVLDAGRRSFAALPSLGEGIWYWTIRADTAGERGVSAGDPSWFTVLAIPLLPAPRLSSPPPAAVISMAQLTAEKSISFNWDRVAGANAYIFSLFGQESPPRLLFTGPPESALSFILENLTLLEHDSYLWQVEAVYRNAAGTIEQRGIIEQRPFSIEVTRSNTLQTRTQEGPLYGQ